MIHESDDEKERERKEFYQTLVCDKKPYFFIYIYGQLKKDYLKLRKKENQRCVWLFGRTLEEVLANPLNEEEEKTKFYYELTRNVDESPSVMNKIAWQVEKEFKNFRVSNLGVEDCVSILRTDRKYKNLTYKKIYALYDEYLKIIKSTNDMFLLKNPSGSEKTKVRETQFQNLKIKMLKICPNEEELCNILLDICYEKSDRSKHLVWAICGRQLIINLLNRNGWEVSYPILSNEEDGDFVYKGYNFKIFTKGVEEWKSSQMK